MRILFIYFDSDSLLKISRSTAVKPKAIHKIRKKSYRSIELELMGNHTVAVSTRMAKQVEAHIEKASWLKQLVHGG